jgi:hypothetical protein
MHLTNSEPRPHSCAVASDFSDATGAPVNEIEVTPEMIAAGRLEIAKVWTEFVSDRGVYIWRKVLTNVYLAMYEARPLSHHK